MARINDLLKEYGTSLEEMRRMHKEVQPLIQSEFERAMLPKIYTYQEAKELFGVDLPEPEYMLKVTPDNTVEEGFKTSYIAPSGFEFGEGLVTTPEGETMDWQKFEEMIARQSVPQRTPEELAMLAYEAPWTEEDIQQTMGLIEAQEVAYKQHMDEYEQTQRIFGKVFPNADVDAVIKFADEKPDAFLRAIRAIGRSEDTEAILRRMLPGISDTDIDKLLTPLPEGAYYIEGTNLLVDPLDFSYIKSGVPNFGTFKEVYYQVKGWPDININTLAPGQMAEMQEIRDREVQARAEYEKRFGAGAFWASRVSAPLQYILPASGKLLDPEKPDINPTDIIFDVATVIPGLGYISKAGHLVKNAVLASKLVRIAETTSAAGFTVGQGMMAGEDWDEMGTGGKAMLTGFTALTAGLTGLGLRSLITPAVRQSIKDAAKTIGREATELATSETGAIRFGKAEAQFSDDISKLTPEQLQAYKSEIRELFKQATNDAERAGFNKQLNIIEKIESEKNIAAAIAEGKPIPKQESATGGTPPPPTPPPAAVIGQAIPPEDPVAKLIRLIKEAKPARAETEILKTEELSKRVAQSSAILESGTGREAFRASTRPLSGQLPKAQFTPPEVGLTADDITGLYEKIRTADIQYFQKLNTSEALNTLLTGQIPTRGDLKLLENMFGKELVEAILSKRSLGQKAWDEFMSVINLPRAVLSSWDLSAPLRQASLVFWGYPKQSLKNLVPMIKALGSDKYTKAVDDSIRNSKYSALREQSGLYIAPIDRASAGLTEMEEAFMTRFADRIPGVKQSQRAYITYLNKMRSDLFDYYARAWEGTGKTIADYKSLARFINHATGRGDIGAFTNSGPLMNVAFFSPRFIASRVQVPIDVFTSSPAVRKVIARSIVSFVGANLGILGLYKLIAGAEVEDNPLSSDYGKVKIGNTRLDFWGGWQPYARVIAQLITGERKTTNTGAIVPINRADVLENFIRGKLSPFAALVVDILKGETIIGEELTTETDDLKTQAFNRLTFMFIQDLVDAINDSGAKGALLAMPGVLGAGVQTYGADYWSDVDNLGLPRTDSQLPLSTETRIYDVHNAYVDIKPKIQGVTADDLRKIKGMSPKVIAIAEARDTADSQKFTLRTPPVNINSDPMKGDTYEQYYNQWKERQKITDPEELKKFDEDYPNAKLGNFGQREYALLKEYYSLSKAEQAQFLKEHPELKTNMYEQWLMENPKENAQLAVWGEAKVLTQAAYNEAQLLIKELDIPDSAVRDYLPPADLAKPYFDYNSAVSEFGANSAEAMIVRAKNPKLTEWLKLEPVRTPIEALEINVKNRTLNEQYDGYSDRNSRWYIADPDARENARKEFRENNPEWVDDQKRIEVYNNNGNETILTEWVEHDRIQRQFGASSPEAKLYLIDHPETFEWAVDNGLLEDEGKGWNIPVLRINAQYRQQDEYYNSIQNDDPRIQAQLREDYLNTNPEYRIARIERDGLELGITTPNLLNEWTEYNQLPKYGYWRKRYLKEHPELYGEVTRLQKEKGKPVWEAIDPDKIPSVQYDLIYEQYKDIFDQYNTLDKLKNAPIDNRQQVIDAWYAREAYKLLFPEEFVANYVEYYRIPESGYADERYLKEHPEFYAEMFRRKEWKDPIDF
ncbi:MAG: hypothetical protein RBT40_07990, partial [Petrimonas sp.]|nr:hypothetical protein [Petrimonas sp.]